MSAYTDSIQALRDEVAAWLRLLDDPFKAPELKVGLPSSVASAAFNTAVEYRVLRRGDE